MTDPALVFGTFAGPGGWAEAARALRLREIGIELDVSACATRAAAGHATVRADVFRYPAELLAGQSWGQCHSPPCTTFSEGGLRGGQALTDVLAELIRENFSGLTTRAARRREMARTLRLARWPDGKMPRERRSAAIWAAVRSASLVAEPARFIRAGHPEWVVLEQVPAVLPLWHAYAAELRAIGYSTWAGKLNTADYGVPQARVRAILIASRVREAARPDPTHYDVRRGWQLWGTPWVSMADAIGWGVTERPAPTVTAGGTASGGWEPFGRHSRDKLVCDMEAGRWKAKPGVPDGAPAHAAVSRLSVAEAAALQSFPPGYPWRGPQATRYRQCGDAVPPLAAMAVIGTAAGIDWQPVAERYASRLELGRLLAAENPRAA